MKITGIIAEFNPFHNGHKYLMTQAREKTGCDFLVVAMSGDFTQRGAPAIVDKSIRTTCALTYGADLVIQLPVIASTASAATFAITGVKLLHQVGVDTIAFGCETDNCELLSYIADIFMEEPDAFRASLNKSLRMGRNFPVARGYALADYLDSITPSFDKEEVLSAIREPNNILAIEYIKAIRLLHLDMNLCPVKREGTHHHDKKPAGEFFSATGMRHSIIAGDYSVLEYAPKDARILMEHHLKNYAPVCKNSFTGALQYKLIVEKEKGLSHFADGSDALSNRIYRHLDEYVNPSQFIALLKSRDYTYTRLSRFLMHVLLNITTDDLQTFCKDYGTYVRILGFKKEAASLFSNATLPVITGVKDADPSLLTHDLMARELYRGACEKKAADSTLKNDYQQTMIIF
ncbi:MAG: nucleotidyltransferase family protein [Lachnospiraceae bacterium]|nr:nucleotidyltransferase family protein [Lachnospiraceae bacterium]